MPCRSDGYPEAEEYLTTRLCAACRLLSTEEMLSICPDDGIIDLYEWYYSHLMQDIRNAYNDDNKNDFIIAINELKRIGFDIIFDDKDNAGIDSMTQDNKIILNKQYKKLMNQIA